MEQQFSGMKEFFNRVAQGYDKHMKNVIKNSDEYYSTLIESMKETDKEVQVAVLGCGTGPELSYIFKKCSNAQITCVDIAENMLTLLKEKYSNHRDQIDSLVASYETVELNQDHYDYIVCAMCLHHYDYPRKVTLFEKILSHLKPGGLYIEGDFMATPAQEAEEYDIYKQQVEDYPELAYGDYHVDVTCTVGKELSLMTEAGFWQVDVQYKSGNLGIMVGRKKLPNGNAKEMGNFFNRVAEGYDEHMENNIDQFHEFYGAVTNQIDATEEPLRILDLGCGTGLELKGVFNQAPHAQITGIDMSQDMLKLLGEKYIYKKEQLNLVVGSYLEVPFEENTYDHIISIMTMHHFVMEDKIELYSRIYNALEEGGTYIEGDYIVDEEEAHRRLKDYKVFMESADPDTLYHIDIPLTEIEQLKVFKKAGFKEVKVMFKAEDNRVFLAKK